MEDFLGNQEVSPLGGRIKTKTKEFKQQQRYNLITMNSVFLAAEEGEDRPDVKKLLAPYLFL